MRSRAVWYVVGGLLTLAAAITTVVVLLGSAVWASDIHNIATATAELVGGRPLSAANLSIYSPTTYILYAPLGLLPLAVVRCLTEALCCVGLILTIWIWGRDGSSRPPLWAWFLLLSPPALDLIYIDQFNAVVALVTLSLAILLLQQHRSGLLVALLGAITLITRPFNTIPLLAGLARLLTTRWQMLRLLFFGTAILGMVITLAWWWDPHLLHDTLNATGSRSLFGLSGTARHLVGTSGVWGVLLLCALLIWLMAAYLQKHLPQADVLAIVIALSVLPVQQGGPYVAIYTLPLIIRLAQRCRAPGLFISGYAATYSLLMLLGLDHHDCALTRDLSAAYFDWPILTALAGSGLLTLLGRVASLHPGTTSGCDPARPGPTTSGDET